MRSRLAFTLIGLAACAAVASWARYGAADAAQTTYLTQPVQFMDMEQAVMSSGTIEPARLVLVGSRASGQVKRLQVRVGDHVAENQLIAEIDDQPQRNALSNAQAALANGRAQRRMREVSLRQAEITLSRQSGMLAASATSQDSYDTALAARDGLKAEIESLQAQVDQATAAVDAARTDLGYTRISAPISGVVLAVVTEEGRTVNAFQSAPTIVILAQLDTMKIKAQVSEADVLHVHPGMPVYFTVLGDATRRYRALLQSVEPAPTAIAAKADDSAASSTADGSGASKAAVYYNAIFEMPNPDGALRPMMTAQVHLVMREMTHVLTLPLTAVQREGDAPPRVRVLADNHVTTRPVTLGFDNGVDVVVLSGLRQGERVVIGDASQATPGGQSWNR